MKAMIEKIVKLMSDGYRIDFHMCFNDQTETRIFAAAYETFDYDESLNALIFGYKDGTINILMLDTIKIIEIIPVRNGVDLSCIGDGDGEGDDNDEYIC